jgi:hypothetical protein
MYQSARDIRSTAFEATLRPARAIYLVDAADGPSRIGARQAIQQASTRWGGACELIILVAEDGAVTERDRAMVELARIDGAVNVNLPPTSARAAAEALGLAVVPLSDIEDYGITTATSNPSAVGESRTVDGSNGFVIATTGGKLWEAAAAGDLAEEHERFLAPRVLAVRRPMSNDEIGRAQVLWSRTSTLATRTLDYFYENRLEADTTPYPAIVWVVRGDDLRDCLEFWNIRALHPTRFVAMPMFLLPEDEVEHWVEFDQQLVAALRRPNHFEPDVVLVSKSVPPEGLAVFAARFGLVASESRPCSRPRPAGQPSDRVAPFTYTTADDLLSSVSFNRSYGHKISVPAVVYDGHAVLEFPSPVPFTMAGKTLVVAGGPAMASLPRRPAVASLVNQDGVWRDNGLQIIALAKSAYRLEITVPSMTEATQALLDEASTKWALSDKGAVGAKLLEGTEIDALLEPNVFEMLLALTTPRNKHMAAEFAAALGKGVGDLSQVEAELAARWSGRAERQFRSAASVPASGLKGPERVEALDRLAGIGWAERGLQVNCHNCHLDSFLPLSDQHARGQASCPGCGFGASYTRGSTSVEIAYRLDSLIDRAVDQGVLAHLLTVAALRTKYAELHLLPGVDVWFRGETEKKEFDLFGICDGKVAAGEVKQSAGDFDQEQVRGDVDKTARVAADIHIMASPGEIAPDALGLAARLCAEASLELIVLDKSVLRP